MTDLTDGPVPMDLRDPAELLSFVPYEFNFQPRDSLVVVSLTGETGSCELGHSARVDLDRLAHPVEGREVQRHMLLSLEREGIVGGFLIIYSEALFRLLSSPMSPAPPEGDDAVALAQHLITWFDYEYFHPERTFIVGKDHWRCLSCAVPEHCPNEGRSTAELKYTAVATAMVLRGQRYLDRREDLVRLPAVLPPGTLDARVKAAIHSVRRRGRRLSPSHRWLADFTDRWNEYLCGSDANLAPPDLAVLALSLYSVRIRDNVIYAICTGSRVPAHGNDDSHFADLFEGTAAPDAEDLERAKTRLRELASHCPPDFREPVLSVWAWCAWWGGKGAEAATLLGMALDLAPSYSLANTLQAVMHAVAGPPWMRNRNERE